VIAWLVQVSSKEEIQFTDRCNNLVWAVNGDIYYGFSNNTIKNIALDSPFNQVGISQYADMVIDLSCSRPYIIKCRFSSCEYINSCDWFKSNRRLKLLML
jgi:hypothetical protein